jgi:uncharacterized membrane protein YbaN (DUF454 family)
MCKNKNSRKPCGFIQATEPSMIKRVLLLTAGWLLLALGVAGLFLPLLPGILLLLTGLALLSFEYQWARRWIVKLRERFPSADQKLQKLMGKHAKHIPGFKTTVAGK